MSNTTLLLVAGAGALYVLTRPKPGTPAPQQQQAPASTTLGGGSGFTGFSNVLRTGTISIGGLTKGTGAGASNGSAPSLGSKVDSKAKQVASEAGKRGAQSLCGAIGAGSLSEECGAIGAVAAGYAYEGGKKAVKAVGNAIEEGLSSLKFW